MRGARLVLAAVCVCALLAPADQELPRPRFVVGAVRGHLGRPFVLTIALEPPPTRPLDVTIDTSNGNVLHVAGPLTVQAGAAYAFLLVTPAWEGEAMLTATIGLSTSKCEVYVGPLRDSPRTWSSPHAYDPRLVSPSSTVCVEGEPPTVIWIEAEDTLEPPIQDAVAPIMERAGCKMRGQWAGNQVVEWTYDVPRTGYYSLIVGACCDEFLDVPECGVVLDGRGEPVARSRIWTTTPSQTDLAPSVKLEAGKHTFSFRFLNDAYDPETHLDRNQYLDRLGISWVGETLPDHVSPSVKILSPPNGETLGGPADVVVIARDDMGVVSMELGVNDRVVVTGRGSRLAGRLTLPAGQCQIFAHAVDAAGNRGYDDIEVMRSDWQGEYVELSQWFDASEAKGMEARREPSSPTGACLAMYASEPVPTLTVRWERDEEVEVRVLARADLYQGPPQVEVEVNGQVLGADVSSSDYREVVLGRVKLGEGDNHVVVRFPNDAYGGSPDTDRNLFVAAVGFGVPVEDTAAPRVDLVNVQETLSGSEMIIARASDNAAVARVELLVDGKPTGSVDTAEPFGMWLDTERLDPGAHRLAARAWDAAGNEATSSEVEVEVVRASHTSPLSRTERGVHLMNRLGMGYSREALERLLVLGAAQWLDRELALPDAPAIETAEFEPVRGDYGRLLLATLARLQRPTAEVRERLALFWDNHFSTFVHKTNPQSEWNEYGRFREAGLGHFRDLLGVSAHSAVMLTYLDNQTNRKGHPNENYAREIMELHTLGVHGGYTQKDVEEVTRILTGWAADAGGDVWSYVPQFHDDGEKRALGLLFPAGEGAKEGEWLLDVLAAHPSTARFVCGKLAAMWVSDDPPPELLEVMSQAFLSSGGDIVEVLKATVAHPAFFDRKHFATKVKDPLEFVMGLSRHGAWAGDLWALDRGMVRLGRRLYECQPPTGYKERAEEWLNSAALLTRWNLAEEAASQLPLGRVFPGGWEGRPVEALLDEGALSLLGRPLAPDRRRIVLEALEGTEGVHRVRALIALVLQMPESQMN